MVKEILFTELNKNYDNAKILAEAFSTIENASVIKNNDTTVVFIDEETKVFYEAQYEILREEKEIVLKNIVPLVLKEERINAKELFAKAMDENISEGKAIGFAKQIARHITKKALGGERSKLIRESRFKSLGKNVNEGRKELLERLLAFKAKNFNVISETKSKNFYDKFIEKFNDKYTNEDASINVLDKINFVFLGRNENKALSLRKKLSLREGLISATNTIFNPAEIIKNSPSFTSKLNKLVSNANIALKDGKDKNLEEAKEVFVNFAKNWPVLFMISEEKHKDFALKHFATSIEDKEKAKELIGVYATLVTGEEFKKEQLNYLKENVDVAEMLQNSDFVKSKYDAKIIDGVVRAISELRESVKTIEHKDVSNYLKFADEEISKMIRTGKFNENLFERLVVDIFGDNKLVLSEKEKTVYDDEDFKSKEQKEVSESDVNTYRLDAKASALIVKIRETIPLVDKAIAMALEEDLDLVKSMMAISAIDEEKLDKIDVMLNEAKKKASSKKEAKKADKMTCPKCGGKMTIKGDSCVCNACENM